MDCSGPSCVPLFLWETEGQRRTPCMLPMKHTLHNGIVLHEVPNPTGGTSWFAEAGEEGMVLVCDTSFVPLEVLAYIVYDRLDPVRVQTGPRVTLEHPHP